MLDFEYYLKSNYNVEGSVSCGIKYSYSNKIKSDKKSGTGYRKIHTITVKLQWFDSNAKLLQAEKINIIDDEVPKTLDKKFTSINGKDLTNKFRVAKNEIINVIRTEKTEKMNELRDVINELNKYQGKNSDIIPSEMKGIIDLQGPEQSSTNSPGFGDKVDLAKLVTKPKFDM